MQDGWVLWSPKDCFSVEIPADATPRLDDDGRAAVIRLGRGAGVAEVLLSNHPLKEVTPARVEQADVVREIAAEFFTDTVQRWRGPPVSFQVDRFDVIGFDGCCVQGIGGAEKEEKTITFLRVYARPGDRRYWLVHWNGVLKDVEAVVDVVSSFLPDDASFR